MTKIKRVIQSLELCRNHNLFILNGRVSGDTKGLFTCRQSSVVDYCMCSHDLLCHIISLTVLEFSSLYTDVHSPLSLYLNFNLKTAILKLYPITTTLKRLRNGPPKK